MDLLVVVDATSCTNIAVGLMVAFEVGRVVPFGRHEGGACGQGKGKEGDEESDWAHDGTSLEGFEID